jgi:DtxR family Mn-dependent transcriptional regulator
MEWSRRSFSVEMLDECNYVIFVKQTFCKEPSMTSKRYPGVSMSQEDYLEAILDLARQTGVARVKDIAERMRVAKSSVTVALRSLAKRGFVHYEPYQFVTLTREGQSLAGQVRGRHNALSGFFKDILDVDESTADANACRIEHAVDDEVMRRWSCFVEFMSSSSDPANRLPQTFRLHCRRHRKGDTCEGCGQSMKRSAEKARQVGAAKVERIG